MKELWERFLNLLPGKAKAETAKIILIALGAGLIFLWSGDVFGMINVHPAAPEATLGGAAAGAPEPKKDELTRMEEAQAKELAGVLTQIQGAGRVTVSVSLEAGPAIEVVSDLRTEQTKTTEKAQDGSTRQTETTSNSQQHLLSKGGTSDAPVVAKQSRPLIAGVIVVAEGAWNAEVRERLQKAAYVKLGIPANKVQVFAAGGSRQ
jgi:stage III sporulation protein AG